MKKDNYNKRNNKENEESIDIIYNLAKEGYYQYYNRTQSIDNKSGFFIAFHGAILLLTVNPEFINNILKLKIYQMKLEQFFKYNLIFVIEILIIILAVSSICMFILSLKSSNIRYITNDIENEIYFKQNSLNLKKRLIEAYKDISDYNEKVIEKKHKIYNYGAMLTLIEVALIGLDLFIKMII